MRLISQHCSGLLLGMRLVSPQATPDEDHSAGRRMRFRRISPFIVIAALLLSSACGPRVYTVYGPDYRRATETAPPSDVIGATMRGCTQTAIHATRVTPGGEQSPADFLTVEESPPGTRLVGSGAGMLLVSLALVSIGSIIVTQADSGSDSFFEPFSPASGWATIAAGGATALGGFTLVGIGSRRRAEAPRLWLPEMTESFPCVVRVEQELAEDEDGP